MTLDNTVGGSPLKGDSEKRKKGNAKGKIVNLAFEPKTPRGFGAFRSRWHRKSMGISKARGGLYSQVSLLEEEIRKVFKLRFEKEPSQTLSLAQWWDHKSTLPGGSNLTLEQIHPRDKIEFNMEKKKNKKSLNEVRGS
jgi:hypothetical protein